MVAQYRGPFGVEDVKSFEVYTGNPKQRAIPYWYGSGLRITAIM